MAVAAVLLGAAGVVMAVSDQGLVVSAGLGSAAESIGSMPDAAALSTTSPGRQMDLSVRADDGGAAKHRPILFGATLAGALLLATTLAWRARTAAPVRPMPHRHRHSLSRRGPPSSTRPDPLI